MGNIHAGSVRIYKFNTFKTFTPKENELHKKKDYSGLLLEIKNHIDILRCIDKKHLTEANEVSVFEGDVIRLALSDRHIAKADFQLIDEIVYMEIYHNDIMKQIIQNGVKIDDKEYVFYTATTGQVRNKTITLIKKEFFEKHADELFVGLSAKYINEHGGMNVGKYLAYTALSLSSSVLPDKEIDIDRCIVVKGLETTINDWVKYIDIQEDENGQCFVVDIPTEYQEKNIEIEHTDGAGMFMPGELPSSCQMRGGYFKGAMFPFNFRKFAKEVAHNTVVVDAWGNTVDIEKENIRFIFTTSQLKMWKMYPSWDAYKKEFKNNGIRLSINSYANPPKDIVNLAYQYLQTLPYGCDIEGVCRKAKEDIEKLGADFEYLKESMGYSIDETGDECDKKATNTVIANALKLYPQLACDSYIRNKIDTFRKIKRKSYCAGKIPVSGYYSYAAPDMYAFCECLFFGNKTPKGLIPKNYVYNKHFDNKGTVEHLICLRSPHLSNYEYGKRNLVKSEECREWFSYMESDTVVSCHDLLSKTLQMDWDGDEILVSDDEELYKLAENKPSVPLYYDMQQAEAQEINVSTICETLIKGFDNNVIGTSSNAITKLWNTSDATINNTTPYDDAINVICAYSNYAIDYPKTGKNLSLGRYKELYERLIPPQDTKSRFSKTEIPLPNFFVEAKNKKKDSVAAPTNNVMDRISKYIGKRNKAARYFTKNNMADFDYRMLMNNAKNENGTAKYEVNRYDRKYGLLREALKTKKESTKKICTDIEKMIQRKNTDSVEISKKYDVFYYHCMREIKKIFTEKNGFFERNLAVNYFVDLEYNNLDFATSSKTLLWNCFGDILVKNLQKNINGEITVRIRPRMSYQKVEHGNEKLDVILDKRFAKCTVDITMDDLSFISNSLPKQKNGKEYKNDMPILYVLYCLYKEAKANNRLDNGYYNISKRTHYMTYNDRTHTRKKEKRPLNMNRIMNIAEVKSYESSLNRLNEMEGITIMDDKENKRYRIKIDMPQKSSLLLFNVEDVYNPILYLKAYQQAKSLSECKICHKSFIKQSNNQKTCSEKCKQELHRYNQAKTNERLKSKKTCVVDRNNIGHI